MKGRLWSIWWDWARAEQSAIGPVDATGVLDQRPRPGMAFVWQVKQNNLGGTTPCRPDERLGSRPQAQVQVFDIHTAKIAAG